MVTAAEIFSAACAFQRLELSGQQTCPLYAYRRGHIVYGLAGAAAHAAKLATALGRAGDADALEALAHHAAVLEDAADAADAAAGYAEETRVWLGKPLQTAPS